MIMNKKTYNKIIIVLFIAAFLIRIINWPIIKDINCDEAMSAINAQSIANTGTDMYGTSFPVYFEAWGFGGQSALEIYLMALCIKIFGFSVFSIKLPSLILSLTSLYVMYRFMNKICHNKTLGVVVLSILAINPWDIIQAQWALDCNLFPHVFLIAVYLLYIGIEEKKDGYLFCSMLTFALTLYTYGVALYLLPVFLLICAIWLLINEKIDLKRLLICFLIFIIFSTPIFLMVIVNLFKLPNIQIGRITVQNYPYVSRTSDMLIFSDNFFECLINNIKTLISIIYTQKDGLVWNSFENIGTLYLFSLPFYIFGIVKLLHRNKKKEREGDDYNRFGKVLLISWLIISLLCGILINGVNINRINIIWYILIIFNGIGIYEIINSLSKNKKEIVISFICVYMFSFLGYMYFLYDKGIDQINNSSTWSCGLVDAIKYCDKQNYNKVKLSLSVCSEDKQDVFIKFATKNKQVYHTTVDNFMNYNYFYKNEKPRDYYSTTDKIYEIADLNNESIFNDDIYVIGKNELQKIKDIDNYNIINFNRYIVLEKRW